jgi:hypothetical protein
MMVIAPTRRIVAHEDGSLYCPHCLRRVCAEQAKRQDHREACLSGVVDVLLLRCPTCGLVLSAEVLSGSAASAGASGGAAGAYAASPR